MPGVGMDPLKAAAAAGGAHLNPAFLHEMAQNGGDASNNPQNMVGAFTVLLVLTLLLSRWSCSLGSVTWPRVVLVVAVCPWTMAALGSHQKMRFLMLTKGTELYHQVPSTEQSLTQNQVHLHTN